MTFIGMYIKFHGLLSEISLFKKYKEKDDFSNSLIHLMDINHLICIYFIPLNRPQNQLFIGICYVSEHLGGRYPSSISLHKIVHYLKDKIGVVYFQCCVIFDTL